MSKELRIAVVATGGVSLAVWMGGVATELLYLAQGKNGPYADQAGSADASGSWAAKQFPLS